MKNFAAIFVVLPLLAACSASRPLFPETVYARQPAPVDKARIIFLRLPESYIGARWARVKVDGAAVGKLARGEFLVVDAVPGEREISVDEGEGKGRFVLKLGVEAQQIYDLQVSRRLEHRKYEATGIFAWVAGGILTSADDDRGPFILEPVHPWQILGMLERLEPATDEK